MQQSNKSSTGRSQAQSTPAGGMRSRVDIHELVGPNRRVTISHGGEDYVLRITRNGKLILTK
jgi:hemin uptake protein HemP